MKGIHKVTNKPVPVLHLVGSSRGGAAVHVQTLCQALAHLEYPILAVMPLDGGNVEPEDFEAKGVRFLPWLHITDTPFLTIVTLARIFETESPSIIHGHGFRAAFWAYWALAWVGLSDIPLVVSVHGFVTPFHHRLRRFLQLRMERLVARRASAVIAVAEAERKALLQARVAPSDKVFTVHLGFNLSKFTALSDTDRTRARESLGIAKKALLFLTVCRLDRPRDFRTLLNAFYEVVAMDYEVQLFIVGDGPMRTEIEAEINALALQNQVKLWGFQRNVVDFYAAADAFVLTSWGWEGLPISVIEAQASGVPVVVTDAGGSRETFQPDQSGILVPRSDSAALAQAFLSLASNCELRHQMGHQGRIFALTNFKLERMVEQISAIYHNTLYEHQHPSSL